MNFIGTKELTTDRLLLRRIRSSDAAEMFENWTKDSRVAKYTSWSAHSSVEDTKMFVDYIGKNYMNDWYYCWGIELDGKLVGNIEVVYIEEETETCGLGYALGFPFWERGIMTEAVKEVIRFLFTEVHAKKIIAGHDNENIGSGRVMEKAGMQKIGVEKGSIVRKDGTCGDSVCYEISYDNWILSGATGR